MMLYCLLGCAKGVPRTQQRGCRPSVLMLPAELGHLPGDDSDHLN